MADPKQDHPEREAHLRMLAEKLEFKVEKTGDSFALTRTTDVSSPLRRKHLTLDQAEDLLSIWKLRGPHGG